SSCTRLVTCIRTRISHLYAKDQYVFFYLLISFTRSKGNGTSLSIYLVKGHGNNTGAYRNHLAPSWNWKTPRSMDATRVRKFLHDVEKVEAKYGPTRNNESRKTFTQK